MLFIYEKRMQCWADSAIHFNKMAGLLRYYFPEREDAKCRKEKAYSDLLIGYVKIKPSSQVYRQLAEVMPTAPASILMCVKALHRENDDLEKAKLAYQVALLSKEEGDYDNALQMAKLAIKYNSS